MYAPFFMNSRYCTRLFLKNLPLCWVKNYRRILQAIELLTLKENDKKSGKNDELKFLLLVHIAGGAEHPYSINFNYSTNLGNFFQQNLR